MCYNPWPPQDTAGNPFYTSTWSVYPSCGGNVHVFCCDLATSCKCGEVTRQPKKCCCGNQVNYGPFTSNVTTVKIPINDSDNNDY